MELRPVALMVSSGHVSASDQSQDAIWPLAVSRAMFGSVLLLQPGSMLMSVQGAIGIMCDKIR